MTKITVSVFPDQKNVKAYQYADTVLLIPSNNVRDTDQSIITCVRGFRYKRRITECNIGSVFFEYHRI